ncbi:MAG: hypothetical protein LBV07_03480 [Syntrophobacterales bacterium]|nr:hypothetical protein [Syntrophobacterales bacterium]
MFEKSAFLRDFRLFFRPRGTIGFFRFLVDITKEAEVTEHPLMDFITSIITHKIYYVN